MSIGGDHDRVAERVARNVALFREANERIRSAAGSMELDHSQVLPFLCECADGSCTTVLQLSQDEYEAVRAHPTHFINARGHAAHGRGWARVLDDFDRYTIVEKVGEAAEIAAELDPRREVSMNERKRRIGENEAIFRSVNEEVSRLNVTFTAASKTMRVVCECGVQSCTEHIEISPAAYRRVREDSRLFIVRPDHDLPETETVIEKTDRYWIVQKDEGLPAALAIATDELTSGGGGESRS